TSSPQPGYRPSRCRAVSAPRDCRSDCRSLGDTATTSGCCSWRMRSSATPPSGKRDPRSRPANPPGLTPFAVLGHSALAVAHQQSNSGGEPMQKSLLRAAYGCAILALVSSSVASAQQCSGGISADEALRAEDARYAAQTSRDFAALEQLLGDDLVYI